MRIPIASGDENRFGFWSDEFGFRIQCYLWLGTSTQKVLTGTMLRRKRKLIDRVLLAYVKSPIPNPCYNGRKGTRFWSSVVAKSDCVSSTRKKEKKKGEKEKQLHASRLGLFSVQYVKAKRSAAN